MAQAGSGKRDRASVQAASASPKSGADAAKREILAARLRAKASEADKGAWVSLVGLTDEEIVASLARR